PRSPLFPYTTLFRSQFYTLSIHHIFPYSSRYEDEDGAEERLDLVKSNFRSAVELTLPSSLRVCGCVYIKNGKQYWIITNGVEGLDRKSTRLNSSHVK